MLFRSEIGRELRVLLAFLKEHKEDAEFAPYLGGLKTVSGQLQQATMWLMQNAMGNPDNAGAGSNDYMHLFGLTLLGYMWARIAKAVIAKKAKGEADAELEAKLTLAKFFNERMMPEAGAHLARLSSGSASIMALPAAAF